MLIITTVVVGHIVYHLEVSVVDDNVRGHGVDEEAYKCDAKSKDRYVSNVLKELSATHIESWIQDDGRQQKIKEEILFELVLVFEFIREDEPE